MRRVQCRELPTAVKDAEQMQGKIAVVRLDPENPICFMWMYEVR